jgi:hypothetical protein
MIAPFVKTIRRGGFATLFTVAGLLLYSRYHSSDLVYTFESNQENIDMIKGCKDLRKVHTNYNTGYILPHVLLANRLVSISVL